jgi:hypothetical protein
MADVNLQVKIGVEDAFSGPLGGLQSKLGGLSGALSAPMNAIKGIGSALAGLGLAAQGAQALGDGVMSAANAFGFGLAKELEDTRTKMIAFAGSTAEADRILAEVRQEANATPFAFKELADATAALLPASKQAGVGLQDVIKQAEVLAALNPSEGLTGAAFSLREALSGDFTSIVERFNLPRERLKQLKEEGVPALEAVRVALAEMGVDASLVAGMANTLGGRWSTFMDTIDSARLQAVSPVYEQLGNALSVVSDIVNDNSDAFGAFATAIGTSLAEAIKSVLAFIVMVQNISTDHGLGVFESIITAIEIRIGEVFGPTAQAIFHAFVASIQAISDAIATVIDFFNSGSTTSEVLKAVIVGITTAFVLYEAAVTAASIATAILDAKTKLMATAQAALNFVMAANPIGIVVLALAALAAALIYAYETNETFRAAVDGAWEALKTAVSSAVEFVRTALDQVMTFIRNLPQAYADASRAIGQAIIDGIRNGVSSAASALYNQMRDIAKGALDAAKSTLGVRSPSVEFQVVGKAIGDGLTLGVNQSEASVNQAVGGLVRIPTMAGATAGGGATGGASVATTGIAMVDDNRPVVIQLDGQVIARTTWAYLKRQGQVGANLGFA